MKKVLIVLGVIFVIAIIAIRWYIGGLNKVVRMNEYVNSQWSEIDNQLKRRSDLIPNLVSTAKGYMKHEREVFENIAEARAKLAGANNKSEKIQASNSFESAFSRLLVVMENYPQLKANDNFLRLMDELTGTENRISVARTRYNRAVNEYNAYIREVFGSFFASKRGINTPFPYFKVGEKDKEVPKVSFE